MRRTDARRAAARLEDQSDRELLKRSAREPEAFGVFYRRHAHAVLGFFINRTACRDTAADLTAETFAQAFLSRRRYRPGPSPARAWLFAIARHELAHFVRSSAVASRARHRLDIAPIDIGADAFERAEDLADLEGQRGAIHAAVAGLSAPVADAVRFRVLEGLPYLEVAARLGCSEAAARQRVVRGLDQLANELEVSR